MVVTRRHNVGRKYDTSYAVSSAALQKKVNDRNNDAIKKAKKIDDGIEYYTGLSWAYLIQAIMTMMTLYNGQLGRSGPTPILLHMCEIIGAIGAPVFASGLTWILSNQDVDVDADGDVDVSSKLMNGTLILFSKTCLISTIAGLGNLSRLNLLNMLTGVFTFLIASKAYCKIFPFPGTISSIVRETKNLLPRIHKANVYSPPTDLTSLLYMICMINVIILKTIALQQLSLPTEVAHNLESLAKLTLVGGSLVTLRDAANQKLLGQCRFRQLNQLVAFVFGSMAIGAPKLIGSMNLISALFCMLIQVILTK